jgi:HemK-related putative methylase
MFGLDLVIEPGVLHPGHFISSRVLAEHLLSLDLRGLEVADVGTGSGILALLAARSGASVVAVDLNPAALACASSNARRNGLADRVSVIESDVFTGLPAETRFDLVITNPPFYPRAAESPGDRAFSAGVGNAFFVTLAEGVPERLRPGGRLLMIQSSDADFSPIARLLEAKGLNTRIVLERRGLFETLTVREFTAG